jgi:cation:H+ antiporter
MSILLLILGFVFLVIGADKLVEGASSFATNLKIPNIVIGLTIVAFGTSAPELVVNVFSSINKHTDLVMGNVLGSNIFNLAAILGLSAIFQPLIVKRNTTWLEIPFNLLVISVVAFLALDIAIGSGAINVITMSDGLILLSFFAIFLIYNIELALKSGEEMDLEEETMSNGKSAVFFFLGLIGLIVGGKLIVDNAVDIATSYGMSERIIGLTIVSVGTSLPELAASVAAVRRGKVDIAVGNVIGSNIFNICLVLGVSSLINDITIPQNSFFDIYVNIALGIALFVFIFMGKRHSILRYQGILFVLGYIAYILYLIFGY